MKNLIAIAGTVSLIAATAAFAAEPLPVGKPAGVTRAQDILDNTPLLVGLGIAAIVAVVIATNDDNSAVSTGTTTST